MSQQADNGVLLTVQVSDLRGYNGSSVDLLIAHANSMYNIRLLIIMCSGFVTLILGFYAYRRYFLFRIKIPKNTASSRGSFHSIFGIFPSAIKIHGSDFEEKEEMAHLMSNALIHDQRTSDVSLQIRSSNAYKESRGSSNTKKQARYFRDIDLKGDDTMLILAFTSLMSMGLYINLHTTYGARMVCMTMVGDEVRWQAVKQSSSKVKRYRLKLSDVISVEIGKQPGQLQTLESDTESKVLSSRNVCPDGLDNDNLFFSLVTQKTSLYLEAASIIDRDSLIRGFKLRLEILRC